ncbi:hypothetical protein ACRQ5Q_14995 [Bradyrhizobium sp. PMVTL-01]|uniref:hypothetical protein n=1 Tax=Bradyrhizobium sp. PMVTL-01 TaxID=3434999 RepID=UPI003F6F13A7
MTSDGQVTADEQLIADILRAELHDRFYGKKIERQEVIEVVAGVLGIPEDMIKVTYIAATGQFQVDIH